MSDYIFENNQNFALTLDKDDELNQYRSNFLFPKEKMDTPVSICVETHWVYRQKM